MPSRFPRGSTVYDKHGRSYVVEEVDGGMVYCSTESGAEMEFPEDALSLTPTGGGGAPARAAGPALTPDQIRAEAGLAPLKPAPSASAAPRAAIAYDRLAQSRHFIPPKDKLDRAACQKLLTRLDTLSPGLLDFAAVTVAGWFLDEHKQTALAPSLSVAKARAVFDAAPVEARTAIVAGLLETRTDVLAGMAHMGEFLLKAMIDKGLAAHGNAYAAFTSRR